MVANIRYSESDPTSDTVLSHTALAMLMQHHIATATRLKTKRTSFRKTIVIYIKYMSPMAEKITISSPTSLPTSFLPYQLFFSSLPTILFFPTNYSFLPYQLFFSSLPTILFFPTNYSFLPYQLFFSSLPTILFFPTNYSFLPYQLFFSFTAEHMVLTSNTRACMAVYTAHNGPRQSGQIFKTAVSAIHCIHR